MRRCQHIWAETRRVFSPGPLRAGGTVRANAATLERLSFGVTSIELRCERCGDITVRDAIGDLRVKA